MGEQADLTKKICLEARSAYTEITCSAPGPTPMPDDETTTERKDYSRQLRDGVPTPIGKDYDSRWDPAARMPGSAHGKFFKFPGNYFVPDTNAANFDQFLLPETTSDLIDKMDRKFAESQEDDDEKNKGEEAAQMHDADQTEVSA